MAGILGRGYIGVMFAQWFLIDILTRGHGRKLDDKGRQEFNKRFSALMGRDTRENSRECMLHIWPMATTWQARRAVTNAETLPILYQRVITSRGWSTISLPKFIIGIFTVRRTLKISLTSSQQ